MYHRAMAHHSVIEEYGAISTLILQNYPVRLLDVGASGPPQRPDAFPSPMLQKALSLTGGFAALTVRLCGGFGNALDANPEELNLAKKYADQVVTQSLHECFWRIGRILPSGHILLVAMGEGSTAKMGEVGASPMLAFPTVYGEPELARDSENVLKRAMAGKCSWEEVQDHLKRRRVSVMSMVVDPLENTSRFARGLSGASVVVHYFDRMMRLRAPVEGYMGVLVTPGRVARAGDFNYRTPRAQVLNFIRKAYPAIRARNIHVWMLGGKKRAKRTAFVRNQWETLGAHLVEPDWLLPTGLPAFTESGSYAPCRTVSDWIDETGELHCFLVDGYSGSAEAIQTGTLDKVRDQFTSLCQFSPDFRFGADQEAQIMHLNPDQPNFETELKAVVDGITHDEIKAHAQTLRMARLANLPPAQEALRANDYFEDGEYKVFATDAAISTDNYTGRQGVELVDAERLTYCVTNRLDGLDGERVEKLYFRLTGSLEEFRRSSMGLLEQVCNGEDYQHRAAPHSDAGRIRHELQMMYFEALKPLEGSDVRVDFDLIDDRALTPQKKEKLKSVLEWNIKHFPQHYGWLELVR